MYHKGLLSALFLSISTGFVFAAPGAVMFRGEPRPFEEGRIAVAGCLANLLIAGITLPFLLYVLYESTGFIVDIIGFICVINTILAVFNLLPFGPFDGIKIIQWNETIWAIMLILAVIILVFLFPFIITLLQ
jgi:Zn-dependent protease